MQWMGQEQETLCCGSPALRPMDLFSKAHVLQGRPPKAPLPLAIALLQELCVCHRSQCGPLNPQATQGEVP